MQPVPLIQCIGTYIWLTESALRENTECSGAHHISSRRIFLPVQTKAMFPLLRLEITLLVHAKWSCQYAIPFTL